MVAIICPDLFFKKIILALHLPTARSRPRHPRLRRCHLSVHPRPWRRRRRRTCPCHRVHTPALIAVELCSTLHPPHPRRHRPRHPCSRRCTHAPAYVAVPLLLAARPPLPALLLPAPMPALPLPSAAPKPLPALSCPLVTLPGSPPPYDPTVGRRRG